MDNAEYGPVIADESERATLAQLDHILTAQNTEHMAKLIGADGEEVILPDSAVRALRETVRYLTQGQAIVLLPLEQALTTQQAADLLNISRPYLVKLLEHGAIPFTKTGTHRRLHLRDVLAYKQQRDTIRRRELDELTHLSEELGLYDE